MSYQNENVAPSFSGKKVVPQKLAEATEKSDYWEEVIDIPQTSWIFDFEEFENNTPSRKKGISFTDEITKRVKGITFIFNCCKQLRLSRSVGLTAATCFHRFYMCDDLMKYHYFEVAGTALFVACKSEECRRSLKDVVKVCARVASGKPDVIDEESKVYWRWKDLMVKLEETMLFHLNFEVTPLNQYKLSMDALKIMDIVEEQNSISQEWNEKAKKLFGHCTYLFELFARIPICLLYSTNCICALVLVLACKKFDESLPTEFIRKEFDTSVEDIIKCYDSVMLLSLEVESLDKYFRILQFIPRATKDDINEIFTGKGENPF